MRRRTGVLAAVIAAAAVLVPAAVLPTADADGGAPWEGEAPLVGGVSRYDRGEWIHNDYVFDDYGADTGSWGQPNVVSLAGSSGDARYPVGPEFAGNAADIVEVRVRRHPAEHDALQVRVRLQTIVDPAVPAVLVRSGAFERVFTRWNARVDAATNTVTFRVPRVLGDGVSTVDLMVGAGLHDGAGGLRAGVPGNQDMEPGEYTTGASTDNRLFDVAFNAASDEPRGGAWNEDAQSDALASGDLSAFVETIGVTGLDSKVSTPVTLGPGYHVRLFESRLGLGEGVHDSFPQYGGSLQPYALWVPSDFRPDQPTPLLLSLHSLSVHHNQYRGGTSGTYTTYYEQIGDRLGAVVVTPLGRGPDGWYRDEAFVDTLEVWADIRRTFPNLDRDQTMITGYSMGGYGTYRLSTLVPDAFASAVSVVGPPTDGIWAGVDMPSDNPYFTHTQLENTRHVPFWITHGVLDELVPVAGVVRQAERLGELGHEYRFALHPVEDHLTFSVKDSWSREAAWLASHPRRVENPADIVLRVRPASVVSDESLRPMARRLLAELGTSPNGAYWVSQVKVAREAGADVTGVVELTSGALATTRTVNRVESGGIDGPSPYALTGNDVVTVPAASRGQVLRGTITDVRALTVDLCRAGFTGRPALSITTNVRVKVTFACQGRRVGATTLVPPA